MILAYFDNTIIIYLFIRREQERGVSYHELVNVSMHLITNWVQNNIFSFMMMTNRVKSFCLSSI